MSRRVAPDWILTIEDYQSGVLEVQVVAEAVNNATLSIPLNDSAELSFEVPAESPVLDYLYSRLIGGTAGISDGNAGGMPFVRLRRRGEVYSRALIYSSYVLSKTETDGQTVFFGTIADIDLTLGEGGAASIRAVDVIGALEGVLLTSKSYKNAYEKDIVASLISAASGQTKVTAETVLPYDWATYAQMTPGRTLAYSGVSILEAMKTLAEMNQGFDFYGFKGKIILIPWEAVNGGGTNRTKTVFFGYGDDSGAGNQTVGNVISGRATLLQPRNRIVTTNEAGKISTKSDSSSISRFGQYGESQSNITRDSTREERETAALRTKPRISYSISANPDLSAEPMFDYFPGDKVTVSAMLGGGKYGGGFMITKIDFDFDEALTDVSHSVEVEVL